MTGENASQLAEQAKRVRRARLRRWWLMVITWVGIPTLGATLYYSFWVSPEYESVTKLLVEPASPAPITENDEPARRPLDTLLVELVHSRGMLEKLERAIPFRSHYQGADLFTRLSEASGTEEAFEFYQKKVVVSLGAKNSHVLLKTRALTPEMAVSLTNRILEFSQQTLAQVTGEPVALQLLSGPSLPDEASYPRRAWSILTVLFVSFALLSVFSMLIGAVRDHANM